MLIHLHRSTHGPLQSDLGLRTCSLSWAAWVASAAGARRPPEWPWPSHVGSLLWYRRSIPPPVRTQLLSQQRTHLLRLPHCCNTSDHGQTFFGGRATSTGTHRQDEVLPRSNKPICFTSQPRSKMVKDGQSGQRWSKMVKVAKASKKKWYGHGYLGINHD